MEIRAVKQDDGLLYKCLARNEFGSSERLIKLIVLGVPEKPSQVRVRDIWSRSALISWQSQYPSASSRVSNYTVQYWRKNSASLYAAQANNVPQNHRREEITVDGLQSSALITNLLPAISYELSVLAHNPVGQSEPSETLNVTTSEEEPSAPPSDVQVEARGSSTLRVMWKIPPPESLNGRLLGFYIGYRPRLTHSTSVQGALLALSTGNSQQQVVMQQPGGASSVQQQQSLVFSFKTADAYENQLYYDIFLTNLKHNHDYEVTVRAFNKAGSGPDCHTLLARTGSPRLPSAPSLQVQRVSGQSVNLRWTTSVLIGPFRMSTYSAGHHPSQTMVVSSPAQLASASIPSSSSNLLSTELTGGSQRFVLCYQPQGERDWYEITVNQQLNSVATVDSQLLPTSAQTSSTGDLVSNLGADSSSALMEQNFLTQPMSTVIKPLNELTNELLSSQHSSQVHTLSNLQPGITYRIYVAAANEYGMGDPSNVVSIHTESLNSSTGVSGSYQPGAALLEASGIWASDYHNSGGVNFWAHQLQPLYTILSSAALLLVIVILVAYLVWQFRLRRHRSFATNSSGSYPSSWTPAATDTIQSEYSVKRHFPPPTSLNSNNNSNQAPESSVYDDRHRGYQFQHQHQHQHQHHHHAHTNRGSSAAGSGSHQQLMRSLNNTTQTIRPVLSSHYHLPADLINNNSNSSNSSTLQFNSGLSHHKGNSRHHKTSSTLNRNQNRQLPPIPYSTLSMKEASSGVTSNAISANQNLNTLSHSNSNKWRQQQQPDYRICNEQQHQSYQASSTQPPHPPPPPPTIQGPTKLYQRETQSTGGSQTPLIYGVIE